MNNKSLKGLLIAEIGSRKGGYVIFNRLLLCFVILFLVRESQLDNDNTICLIAFPILLCLTDWLSIKRERNIRLRMSIIMGLVSFCYYGNQTLLSFALSIASGFTGFALFEIINAIRVKERIYDR